MNGSHLRPPRHALPAPIPRGKARMLSRPLTALTFLLFAMAWVLADIAAAAPGRFDGSYKGMFALSSGSCPDSKLEQVMSISGDRVYVDRKSINTGNPLILSGTVGPDGSVSASGTGTQGGPVAHTIFYTLIGKIENGEFVGELSNRQCSFAVKMKK